MMLKPPKSVFLEFSLHVYKDMEFAYEIKHSYSYADYKKARADYEQEIKKSIGNYFVELAARTKIEYEDGRFEVNERQLAHN